MRYIYIFVIFIIISCTDDKWKITPQNKFLGQKTIDTTMYSTYDNLSFQKKITKISTSDSLSNETKTSFRLPLVSTDRYVFIAKKCFADYRKQVFLRLNKNGDIQDSIIINKNVIIANDYIIDDDFYYSWFIDNSTAKKNFKNINYRSDADSANVKAIVANLRENKVPFILSTNDYENDVANYIITFTNNSLTRYIYSANISKKYLDIPDDRLIQSKKIKNLGSIKSDVLFKVDNFFAKSYNEFIQGNKIKGFNPTGGHSECDKYLGTYYITLSNKAKLKLKIKDDNLCKGFDISEFSKYQDVYTEDFLNFYLINVNQEEWKNPVYYVLRK